MWCKYVPSLPSAVSCSWVFAVGLLLAVGGGASVAQAAEPTLEVRVPDHAVTVGDRLPVRVHAHGGEDSLWGDLALASGEGEPWVVVEGPREIPGAIPPVWEVILVPLQVGDLELPSIEASLRDIDGLAVNIAPNLRPTVTVASVLAPEDEGQPAPLRDPVGVEGFPWEWAVPFLILFSPVVVAAALWWRSRTRAGSKVHGRAARLAPIDELQRLLREVREAIGRQPAEVVCDRLAFGVRHYLERRTGDPAGEMTSNELRMLAREAGWPQGVQVGLQRLTAVADGVRFGRKIVADSDLEAARTSAHLIGEELEVFLTPDAVAEEVGQ